MKKFIALTPRDNVPCTIASARNSSSRGERLVTLGITVSARPHWIVYAPANTV